MIIELICDIYAFETLKSNCAATQTLKKKKEKENMNNIYIYNNNIVQEISLEENFFSLSLKSAKMNNKEKISLGFFFYTYI